MCGAKLSEKTPPPVPTVQSEQRVGAAQFDARWQG